MILLFSWLRRYNISSEIFCVTNDMLNGHSNMYLVFASHSNGFPVPSIVMLMESKNRETREYRSAIIRKIKCVRCCNIKQ